MSQMVLEKVEVRSRIGHDVLERAGFRVDRSLHADAVSEEGGKLYKFVRVTGGWECIAVEPAPVAGKV